MRRVLFDSDVLLDVLAQRQPFVVASAQALNRVTQPQVQGYVSGHAVTNIFILRRQVSSEVAPTTHWSLTGVVSRHPCASDRLKHYISGFSMHSFTELVLVF